MSSLRNKFKQVAQEQVAQQYTGTTGVLVGYNNKMNTATIKFKNPNGIGYLYRENVPVSCNLGGISSSSPICGQRCIIMFTNGNILTPVVTGIADREYSENIFSRKTCSDQGAYILDYDVSDIEIEESVIPLSDTWLCNDNKNKEKYNNNFMNYEDSDVAKSINEDTYYLDKYDSGDDGITNLISNGTIKVKKNGDIDIFVSNNIGIRISPNTGKINVYGDVYTVI